ncbi:MAG: glycosyltransferase family 4 protein [Planctomycetota bacterium]
MHPEAAHATRARRGKRPSRLRELTARYDVVFVTGAGHLDYYCGMSESIREIARHIRVPSLVVTGGPYGLTRRLLREGLAVRVLPFDQSWFRGLWASPCWRKATVGFAALGYAVRLAHLLRLVGARVVYATNDAAILAPLGARLAGARLVTGIRGSDGKIGRWAPILRLSDRVVVLSREMRENLLRSLPSGLAKALEPRISVIYNGVSFGRVDPSPEAIRAARRAMGASDEDAVVLYVAAFRAWKGQLRFIRDVVPRIPERARSGMRILYAFLGSSTSPEDARYEAACREAARDSKASERIRFLGFREDPWPWYAASDIVALASEHEGMSRAIIEAMASGKPVVACDVCSARELLGCGAGLVVPRGETAAMARAIADLADRPEVARAMGEAGARFAREHLEIGGVARAYEQLFRSLIRTAGDGRRYPSCGA